jgi:hypothetical protein
MPTATSEGLHDVAITNVTLSKTTVTSGEIVHINVTAENQGDFTETFNVTSTVLTFNWDTTHISGGIYTIKAEASIVPNETDIIDSPLNATLIEKYSKAPWNGIIALDPVSELATFEININNNETLPTYPNWSSPTSYRDFRHALAHLAVRANYRENFSVSVYYTRIYDPLIGTQNVTLTAGANTTLTFEWTPNMTGRHEIKAEASKVPGEVDAADNTRTTIIYVGYGGETQAASQLAVHS